MGDEERRSATRAVWARGDYTPFGDMLAPVGAALCDRVGVAGLDVLDVGTGTGGTALAAARRGARVSGLDLTPELLAVARERSAAEDLPVRWLEGDAVELPYSDAAFDRVLSTFGVIFAPDPRRAATELVRVCRPRGMIAVCGWTFDGMFGRLEAALRTLLPSAPPQDPHPLSWGERAAMTGFFSGLPVRLSFDYGAIELAFTSVEAAVVFFEETSGSILGARDTLEPDGRWAQARAAMGSVFSDANVATDGTLRMRVPYLVAIAVRYDHEQERSNGQP